MTQRAIYENFKEQVTQTLETLQRGEFTQGNFKAMQEKAWELYEKSKKADYDATFILEPMEVQAYIKIYGQFTDKIMDAAANMAFLLMDIGLSEIMGEE